MDWKFLFLSGDGRIGRKDFWLAFLLIMAVSFVLGMVPILGQLIGLALIWPQVCIHAKRLHDMGRSAWLILAPFGVTIVCMILAGVTGGMAMLSGGLLSEAGAEAVGSGAAMAGFGMVFLFMSAAMLVGLAFLLWIGLTPSQPGENQYGPPAQPVFGAPPPPPSAPPPSSPATPPTSGPIVE